jgi:transcriptional regulator with XRE-family HTH domain
MDFIDPFMGGIVTGFKTPLGQQIKVLMQYKGIKTKDLPSKADISLSSISRYLRGASELRSDVFVSLLKAVGVDLPDLLQREINSRINKENHTQPLGSDLELILDNLSPIEQKTLLSTFIRKSSPDDDEEVKEAIKRVSDYRSSITFRRRQIC